MNRSAEDPVSRLLTLAPNGERADAAAIELRKRAAERYWNAWPEQRDRVLAKYKKLARELARRLKLPPGQDLRAVFSQLRYVDRPDGLEDVVLPDGEVLDPHTRFNLAWLASAQIADDALAMELLGSNPFPIATPDELAQIVAASDEELKAWPPVYAIHNDEEDDYRDSLVVGVAGAGEEPYIVRRGENEFSTFDALLDIAQDVFPMNYVTGSYRPDVRTIFQRFRAEFWASYESQRGTHGSGAPKFNKLDPVFSRTLAQATFPEAKRIVRGLALAPDGIGWSEIIGEFALMHLEAGAEHNLRLEGGLIPEWWGKPSDNASLRAELSETGHDGVAVFYNAVGLVLHSDAGHVDVEIDDLISRVGLDPRSKAERSATRLKIWRILTILGAVRVVGARRRVVRDRVSGKSVQLESTDPLLSVSPWKRVGTQETFDAGAAPLAVTIQATPWLARWRGNRAVLQDFGNLLAISEIPIGKPSMAWARAIGWALQQLWREQATRATYARTGDDHRPTARFEPFTRRQLLELFPPKPNVYEVLKSKDPGRAVAYWDVAIGELRKRGVISHYGGSRDWSKGNRPRQGWADLWLDEPLDMRPSTDGVNALSTIATAAKRRRKSDSKLREFGPPNTADT